MSVIYKTKNRVIELTLHDTVTFIGGDSGAGKSLLAEAFYDIMVNPDDELNLSGIRANKIRVVRNDAEANNLKDWDLNRCLVIVDRYDSFTPEHRRLVVEKIKKWKSTWIIMTRWPGKEFSELDNFQVSGSSYKIIEIQEIAEKKILRLRMGM